MTINEYQKLALDLEPVTEESYKENRLFAAVQCMNDEFGEVIDILDEVVHEKPYNSEALVAHAATMVWYISIIADAEGYDLETAFQLGLNNIDGSWEE